MKVSFDPLTGTTTSTAGTFAEISEGKLSGDLIPDDFDDVQRFPTLADFPATGVVARIYFSADNNVPHRWDPGTLSYLPIVADSDGGEF
jgi:hypothetical protein